MNIKHGLPNNNSKEMHLQNNPSLDLTNIQNDIGHSECAPSDLFIVLR